MLEFARLLLNFRFTIEREAVGKQALSQTVPTNDVRCPAPPAHSQSHNLTAVNNRESGRL
jgi:hypothetical protein